MRATATPEHDGQPQDRVRQTHHATANATASPGRNQPPPAAHSLASSPRMTAQRRAIASAFGPAASGLSSWAPTEQEQPEVTGGVVAQSAPHLPAAAEQPRRNAASASALVA